MFNVCISGSIPPIFFENHLTSDELYCILNQIEAEVTQHTDFNELTKIEVSYES